VLQLQVILQAWGPTVPGSGMLQRHVLHAHKQAAPPATGTPHFGCIQCV
jgi:hypothetical protein